MTVNHTANEQILKAKKLIVKAIDLLLDEPSYWNEKDIFHNNTVYLTNNLITISKTLTEIQDN